MHVLHGWSNETILEMIVLFIVQSFPSLSLVKNGRWEFCYGCVQNSFPRSAVIGSKCTTNRLCTTNPYGELIALPQIKGHQEVKGRMDMKGRRRRRGKGIGNIVKKKGHEG